MQAIIDKYGFKEGLVTEEGVITSWPYDAPQPSDKELRAIIALFEARNAYKALRIKSYPPIEEQLDMMFKDEINGTSIWKDTLLAIKLKYPKPL